MNTLNGYSKSTLTDNYVLTAAGGHLAVGNASGNIPLSNSTVCTNLNADLLDDHHGSWYLKNVLAFKLVKGTNTTGGYDLNTLTEGLVYNYLSSGYWKNGPSGMSYGSVLNLKNGSSNSLSGQLAWDVYHNNTTDTTRSLWWRASDNGTFAYSQWHKIAFLESIPTVTDYYWADISVSDTADTTTTPTFATATATTQVTTPKIHSDGRLTLNTTSTGLDLKWKNDNTKSVILNGTAFKPFDTADGNLTLGSSNARWSNIYSVLGNFTGSITIAKGNSIVDEGGSGIVGINPTGWTGLPSDGSAIGFGTGAAPVYIRTNTDNLYHYHKTNGTSYKILDSNNSSVTGDGGSTWGSSITVKINGTSKTLTIPSDPNTDSRVQQSKTTTSSMRPILMGYTQASAVADLETDVTNKSYVSSKIYAVPSTGTLYATTFSGNLAWSNITGKPTIPTISSRNLTVNGTDYTFYSDTTTAAASFYAPTSVGNSNQILVSGGSTSYPTPYWENRLTYSYPGIIWIGYIYRTSRSYTTWYISKQGGSATVSMYISSPTSSNNYQVALQSSTHNILGGMCSIQAQFNAGRDGGQTSEGPLYAYSTVDVDKIEEAGPDVFVTTTHNGYFYIKAMRASDADNTSYYFDGLAFTGLGRHTNSLPLARINIILFGY